MADFFRSLKGKFSDTIKDLSAPPDPYERKLTEHVERATSDLLTGPDWGLNLELIDTINNDPQGACDKVYRAMRKCLLKNNIHTQLLTLNLLEACVKNCVPFFFQQLIYSDLWQEIMRAGDPMRNWDAEVRDRALGLVEDFGRGLPLPAYKDAYESLLDRGVDFPVRPQDAAADGGAPYYTPPPVPAAAVAAAEGLSPEDRAAIAAAVADLEAQAAQQEAHDAALAPPGLPSAGHVPALMGPAVLMGAPIRPPGYQPPAGYHPPHQAAVQPAMVAGAEPIGPGAAAGGQHSTAVPAGPPAPALPSSREEVEQALRVSRNSAELLQEMLAPIKTSNDKTGVHETFVTDLADQCYRYKSVIHELIPRIADEDLISGALLANDEVSKALNEYEALMRAASAAAGGALGGRGSSTGGGVAAAAAAAGAGAAGAGALLGAGGSSSGGGAGTFTLLGEDEDEGPELALHTSRGTPAAAALPAATSSTGAAPAVPAATSGTRDDLISFGSSSGAAPAAPAVAGGLRPASSSGAGAAAPSAHVPGEEQLVSEMDQLLLSAQPASRGASTAGAAGAASATGTAAAGGVNPPASS